ncbi:RHS repeat-associated core domain-containing protein [Spirillospora sp. NPDC047279]|uniref:RHS repeat-associated core domain-containing protein n=1 Tax=Spirillospora sp. NPDC047279 TaxID=3155478 RepID=UPI0033EFFCF5
MGAVTGVHAAPAGAAATWPPIKPAAPHLAKTTKVPVKPRPVDRTAEAAEAWRPTVSWPSAGKAEAKPPSARSAAPERAGGLPVWVGAAAVPAGTDGAAKAGPPAEVGVELVDHAGAVKQGVDGLILKLRRTDGNAEAGRVSLTVDYSSFRYAYGGDWAARLRLVELREGSAAKVLKTKNDVKAGKATADAAVTGEGATFALAAEPNGETGDYRATSLSPAGTWAVSTQSGDFTYSYPLRFPAAPGELKPDLSLSYSSGAVDGRTAATNNQTSVLGEGWTMWPGSIERSYKGCADDVAATERKTGDLCWELDNATMSFGGRSTPLVYAGKSSDGVLRWRPESDDGSRVERFTGASNGDKGGTEGAGEYWKVTTTDGTQYFFGQNSSSAWTVPVYGNESGEPCHASTFDASWCNQAYRWNLDKVVDTHGNVMTYSYTTETNNYGRNLDGAKTTKYVRGGVLDRIDYGGRAGEHATAAVVFDHAERGGSDVPTDQACADGQNCGTKYFPTFWTTKRLAKVTTQVWKGGAFTDVDRWTFEHSHPANTDGTTPSLWLAAITHTGLAAGPNVVGQAVSLPKVTFGGVQKPNRLNSDTDGLLPMNKWRIATVNNESGGTVEVHYLDTDCVPASKPDPKANTSRCYPVIWTPDEHVQVNDWMNKYVVQSISQLDRVGGQQTEKTAYEYVGGTAWRQDDNPLIPEKLRTWSQYRGYEKVHVKHGDPSKGTQSSTLYQYFRGMDGATVDGIADTDPLAGFLRKEITYEGAGGPVLTTVVHRPWKLGPTATHGTLKAYVVKPDNTTTRETLKAGGTRTSEVNTRYNDQGLPVQVNDRGDLAVATDDRCTTTAYARNEGSWLLDLPSEVRTDGVACGTTPSYPRDAISHTRTSYDGRALGAAPTAGNATRIEELKDYVDGKATHIPSTRTTYDAYGRPLTVADVLDRTTTTSYEPRTGLPTAVTVTNPKRHVTTTTHDLVLGQPVQATDPNGRRTDMTYDALGRLIGVWLPGRDKGRGDTPNNRYAYEVRSNGPSWVSTAALKANGNTTTSYALFDGFLRPRQKQAWGPGPAGEGPLRVLTDTLYDSRGLTFQANGPYADTGTPGTALAGVDDTEVTAMTRTTYDGAERPTVTSVRSLGNELFSTTTKYFGDHVEVTPPRGAVPVASYTDVHGRVTEKQQFYAAATPTGDSTTTRYTYEKAGRLATVTDTAGNTWRYDYDLLGRQKSVSDPDRGVSTLTYDDAGQLAKAKDARGETLAYRYDELGRKIGEFRDDVAGTQLASWTYDSLLKGQLTSSTRHVGGDNHTTEITGYDAADRPTGRKLTLPAGMSPLDGEYVTTTTYKADGSPATVTLPALPGNSQETLTYSYDSLGLPYAMKGKDPYVVDAAYSEFGELSQFLSGAADRQVAQTFYFERGTRRLSESVVHSRGGPAGSVQDLKYGYDQAGNVTSIADRPEVGSADMECFAYDGLRRLTHAWTTTATACGSPGGGVGGPAPYWTTYSYDAIGNRLTETDHAAGSAATARTVGRRYAYPAAGKARPHGVTSISGGTRTAAATSAAYAYDAAGNTISRPGPSGPQTLTWTPHGKLETVTSGSAKTTNRYDAELNQVATTDDTGVTVHFGADDIRYDKSTGRFSSTRYYQFGGGPIGVRGPGGLKWLAHDHHGTDRLTVNAADSVTALRRTDPFGNPRAAQPAWTGSRGFVGGIQQPTGLTRLGARDYDPDLGRFLSVDPIVDSQDPQQLNAYAYAANNPTTMTDPDGLKYFLDNDGPTTAPGAAAAKNRSKYDYNRQLHRAAERARTWRYTPKFCTSGYGAFYSGCKAKPFKMPYDPRANPFHPPEVIDPTVGRAAQHDWNGGGGSRGHIGGHNSDRVIPDWTRRRFEVVNDLFNKATGRVSPLIGISGGPAFQSGSLCGQTSVGALLTVGAQACVNWDSVGVSMSMQGKGGLEFGAGADLTVVLRLNTQNAEETGGGIGVSAAVAPKLIVGVGGGAKAEVALDFLSGKWSGSVSYEIGVGGKVSLGELSLTSGVNSGYLFEW